MNCYTLKIKIDVRERNERKFLPMLLLCSFSFLNILCYPFTAGQNLRRFMLTMLVTYNHKFFPLQKYSQSNMSYRWQIQIRLKHCEISVIHGTDTSTHAITEPARRNLYSYQGCGFKSRRCNGVYEALLKLNTNMSVTKILHK